MAFFKKILFSVLAFESRLILKRYRPRIVAVTGLRNQLPALAVRFVPRFMVRKITKHLNASPAS